MRSSATHFRRDDSGQILPWVAVLVMMFVGFSALIVDIGHAMIVQRQLQVSADAAAIAAAETLPASNYQTIAQTYSAAAGGTNTYSELSVGTPTVTGLCLTTLTGWGIPCSATSPNAVQVTQKATVNTFFAGVFGIRTMTLSATSTAAARGSIPLPYNVAIIVDSTLSMMQKDPNCNNATQMACALSGVQQLLKVLTPSVDNVALFTFPNVTVGTAAIDSSCPTSINSSSYPNVSPYGYISMLPVGSWAWYSGNSHAWSGLPTAMPYTFPLSNATTYAPTGSGTPTYQVVGFSSDFRVSDSATALNPNSKLVKASGGVSGCSGMLPPNFDGDYGTYYAGAIYAAQSALLAEQQANPGSQNVIILLGDGNSSAQSSSNAPDSASPGMPSTTAQATQSLTSSSYTYPGSWPLATSNGRYPSWIGECGQAVTAAQYAATYAGNPTRVYTIAYGASTSSDSNNCASDQGAGSYPGISPCTTMQKMASGPTYFYSDYYAPGGDSGCQASGAQQTISSLDSIFKAIATDLTSVRLIPNGTP